MTKTQFKYGDIPTAQGRTLLSRDQMKIGQVEAYLEPKRLKLGEVLTSTGQILEKSDMELGEVWKGKGRVGIESEQVKSMGVL